MQVDASFLVHRHHVGAHVAHLADELLGLYNHQMDVERFFRKALHMADYRESEGDVGHKDTVHHVEMNPVGGAAVEPLELVAQVAEVG